jgi:4-amino-4-deoxy-L-arabinose transferase-like glycosyltransferase
MKANETIIYNNKRIIILFIIILLGPVLQLLVMFFALGDPNKLFWLDPNHYYSIAESLYRGEPYSISGDERNIYRSPGYPFLMSLMMRITGTSILRIRLFHVVLFPFFLLALFYLGESLINTRTGMITMLLASSYPLYVYTPLTLYPESILIYLFGIIALLLFHTRQRHDLLTLLVLSTTISFAIMVRPTAIVWVPTSVLYLFWREKLTKQYIFTVLLGVMLLPVIPVGLWMLRNQHVHGCAVFSTAGSINLLRSYNEQASWRTKETDAAFEDSQKALLEGRTLSEKEKIRFSQVRGFIKNNPGKTVTMAIMRCLDLWNPIPRTITKGGTAKTEFKIISAAIYLPLLALGVFGFVRYWNNPLVETLVILMILNTVVNGIMAVSVRYRAVTDFGFILMAAATIDSLITKYRSPKNPDHAKSHL